MNSVIKISRRLPQYDINKTSPKSARAKLTTKTAAVPIFLRTNLPDPHKITQVVAKIPVRAGGSLNRSSQSGSNLLSFQLSPKAEVQLVLFCDLSMFIALNNGELLSITLRHDPHFQVRVPFPPLTD